LKPGKPFELPVIYVLDVTLFSYIYIVCILQSLGKIKSMLFWWAYWVGLGILSSVGLGTGLHTFLLYLVSEVRKCYWPEEYNVWD